MVAYTKYSLGWLVMYGLTGHMMVITEGENLRNVYDEVYVEYYDRVPRYL
jgi:hypothetical protein